MLFALGLFLNPAECEKCILDAISFDSASLRHICHVIHVIVYVSLTVIPAQRSYRPVRQLMLPCLGRFCGLPAPLTSRFYVITYFDIIKTIPRTQAPSMASFTQPPRWDQEVRTTHDFGGFLPSLAGKLLLNRSRNMLMRCRPCSGSMDLQCERACLCFSRSDHVVFLIFL